MHAADHPRQVSACDLQQLCNKGICVSAWVTPPGKAELLTPHVALQPWTPRISRGEGDQSQAVASTSDPEHTNNTWRVDAVPMRYNVPQQNASSSSAGRPGHIIKHAAVPHACTPTRVPTCTHPHIHSLAAHHSNAQNTTQLLSPMYTSKGHIHMTQSPPYTTYC